MHRKICLGIGVVIASAAGSSALGVTVIPVGPRNPVYEPFALNNQGDVMFQVYSWLADDYAPGDPLIQVELDRANGDVVQIGEHVGVSPRALGPSGEFVIGIEQDGDYDPDPFGVPPPVRYAPELVKPDGSRIRLPEVGWYTEAIAIMPDGRVSGEASAIRNVAYDYPSVPFVWDEQSGVTELALPAGTIQGFARYGALDGSYVGLARDGVWGGYSNTVWWNTDGTIASTFDMDLLHTVGVDQFVSAGVLADGRLLGYERDFAYDGTTVITITSTGDVAPIPIDTGLWTDITGVNAQGTMIGKRHYEGEFYTEADCMIWNLDGIGFPLDRFLPSELHRTVSWVIDINDNGDVLVLTRDIDGGYSDQTYLITGLPAPGAASALVCAGAFTGARRRRRRRIAIGTAAACFLGAPGSSTLGVSAIPIGPEGPSHYPVEVNNQGDVLFQVWTWWEPTHDESEPAFQAEVIRGDGTITRVKDQEWYDIRPMALGPNGEFVVGLGWLDYEHELPTGGVPMQFEPELVKPDGSCARLPKIRKYVDAVGFTPDGRVIGQASDVYTGEIDYPIVPFLWDEHQGVTELALPPNTIRGGARYTDKSGRVIGGASDGVWGGHAEMVWWNPDGTIGSTFDMDLLHAVGADQYFFTAGVLADGRLLGYVRDDNLDGTTVLTISASAQVTTIPIDAGLGVEIFDVNTDGLMVGRRFHEGEYHTTADWMIWGLDGIGFPLDRFLPGELGRYISQVIDFNDRGDVLVTTYLPEDWEHTQTYLITGLPAPGPASVVVCAGVMTGARRRRRIAIGAAAACLGGAGGASAVSITPVGPAGITHYPVALNERGDVLFDVRWHDWTETPTEMISGPAILPAGGAMSDLKVGGAIYGYGRALGEDGAVIGSYGFPFPESSDTVYYKYAEIVKNAAGADIPYTGQSPFAHFYGVTPDGTYFGAGSNTQYLGGYDPGTTLEPIAWDPTHGETVLHLPDGSVGGSAQFWNPVGGYVGTASNEELAYQYLWWDTEGNVVGSISNDTISAVYTGGSFSFNGVRADGALICTINDRLLAARPDGTIEVFGAPLAYNVEVWDMNTAGISVGMRIGPLGAGGYPNAILLSPDGELLELQSLLPVDSPWRLVTAVDVTEAGDVLVHAVDRETHSTSQAFIIRGIPTPGAGAVALSIGAMVVVVRPARRKSV